MVGGGQIERGLDCRLLLRRRRRFRRDRTVGLARQDAPRQGVHLRARGNHRRFGPGADLLAAEGRIEREGQFFVIETVAQAKLAFGARDQNRVDPGLVLGHRLGQSRRRRRQAGLRPVRQFGGMGSDQFRNDAVQAGVLLGDGLGVDQRHAGRLEIATRLGEKLRQLFHARHGQSQPRGQRRELARHQRIERVAGDLVIDQRIPRPALQDFVRPQIISQLVVEDDRVHLIVTRQRGFGHGVQLSQKASRRGRRGGAALGGKVVDLAVEAVIAQLRRRYRAEPRHGVEPTFRQIRENSIGSRRRRRGVRRPRQDGCGHDAQNASARKSVTHRRLLTARTRRPALCRTRRGWLSIRNPAACSRV